MICAHSYRPANIPDLYLADVQCYLDTFPGNSTKNNSNGIHFTTGGTALVFSHQQIKSRAKPSYMSFLGTDAF